MDNMIDIVNYDSIDFKNASRFLSWSFILTVLIIFSIIILFKFDFDFVYNNKLVYNNNHFKMIINEKDLNKVVNNKRLTINDKMYNYKIFNIGEVKTDNIQLERYYLLTLDIKTEKKYRINNNVLNVRINYERKNGFKMIKNFILGKGN